MPAVNTRSDLAKSHNSRLLYWAFVLNPIDAAARRLRSNKNNGERKRVLFARLDGIGDYLIWTTVFDAIRDVYPSDRYERILIGNELWRDLVEPDMFDETLFVNTKKFVIDPRYRFAMMRRVRSFDADIAVNPRLTREFLWNDSVIRVSDAATKIGSEGISNRLTATQKRISDKWYTTLLPPPRDGDHESISYLDFVKHLAGDGRDLIAWPPSIGEFQRSSIDIEAMRFAVLFLGAQIADKQWPVEKFADVATYLHGIGMEIVVAGGESERSLGERFGEAFGGQFRDMIGKTSLPQLAELIGNARLVVTNDTGAGHIAVAADTPVVVITPGNHVGRFFPYPRSIGGRRIRQQSAINQMECFGCRWDCIFTDRKQDEPTPCVADVTVNEVIAKIDMVLKES